MAEQIQTIFNIQFPGGITIAETQTQNVEAYDRIEVDIINGANDFSVKVQPSDKTAVRFFLIKSDNYSNQLTYSIGQKESDAGKRFKLDAIQIFASDGMLGLLPTNPENLFFYNGSGKNAKVIILVGRQATAASAPSATAASAPSATAASAPSATAASAPSATAAD